MDFLYNSFNVVFPGRVFLCCEYIEVICDRLIACLNGKINRLIINIPPRHMKSFITSVTLPAFILAKDPTLGVIVASYSNALSIKHSLDTKLIMSSDWYKNSFPDTVLGKAQNTKNKFITTQMGFRLATSISGTLTGEGGDILIADDPINALQASSNIIRQKVQDWFFHTFITRLNHRKKSIAIIIMQRLHEDDICGYLQKNNKGWNILSLPCIAKSDEEIFSLNSQELLFKRSKGSILNNKYLDPSDIEEIKREVGTYNFASQFQQDPISQENTIIKRDWINRYKNEDEIPNIQYITQSWDTAISNNDYCDYSVCATFAKSEGDFYLLDVFKKKLQYPDLKYAVVQNAKRWKADFVLIENKSSGQVLIQDLKASTSLPITCITPKTSKLDRLYKVVSVMEMGRLFLPLYSPWLSDFEHEFFSFPNTKNDDQLDSVTQYLSYEISKNNNKLNIRFL